MFLGLPQQSSWIVLSRINCCSIITIIQTGKVTLKQGITAIKKEMGLTEPIFFRSFKRFIQDIPYTYSESHRTISFQLDNKKVEINLGPEQFRQLSATARLPVMEVEIRLHGFSPSETERFISKFNLRFLRGGG